MIGLFFNILTQVLFLFVGNPQRLFTHLRQVNTSPVVIVQQKEPELADSLVKHIYLSFDDGPLPGTSNCVDICTNQNVSATFFEVAFHESRSNYGRNLYQRILKNDRLFDIANHSFSHAFFGDYLDYYHLQILH
jgi:peptidoglycan/xylan/chitin deacetylase (PgdA/CDA1 family)